MAWDANDFCPMAQNYIARCDQPGKNASLFQHLLGHLCAAHDHNLETSRAVHFHQWRQRSLENR